MSFPGCAGDPSPEDEPQEVMDRLVANNSLTSNSLTSNSLTSNSLTSNSLTSNSLTSNSLTSNSLLLDALRNQSSRDVFKYIVSCALKAGESIDVTVDGVAYQFAGELGLAHDWSTGACYEYCQKQVSSCVIARVNYLGERVALSLRGAALDSTSEERSQFSHVEAAYLGNIFSQPSVYQACLPAGVTEIPRVCGPSLAGCFLQSVGECDCYQAPPYAFYYNACRFSGPWRDESPLTVFLE